MDKTIEVLEGLRTVRSYVNMSGGFLRKLDAAIAFINSKMKDNDNCRYCGAKFQLDKDTGMYHHKESDCTISKVMFTKEATERRV